jgi:hypothetical protein
MFIAAISSNTGRFSPKRATTLGFAITPRAAATWAESRTAYTSGIGLRQLAHNMNIPAGILARSKRQSWMI